MSALYWTKLNELKELQENLQKQLDEISKVVNDMKSSNTCEIKHRTITKEDLKK